MTDKPPMLLRTARSAERFAETHKDGGAVYGGDEDSRQEDRATDR